MPSFKLIASLKNDCPAIIVDRERRASCVNRSLSSIAVEIYPGSVKRSTIKYMFIDRIEQFFKKLFAYAQALKSSCTWLVSRPKTTHDARCTSTFLFRVLLFRLNYVAIGASVKSGNNSFLHGLSQVRINFKKNNRWNVIAFFISYRSKFCERFLDSSFFFFFQIFTKREFPSFFNIILHFLIPFTFNGNSKYNGWKETRRSGMFERWSKISPMFSNDKKVCGYHFYALLIIRYLSIVRSPNEIPPDDLFPLDTSRWQIRLLTLNFSHRQLY